MLLGAPTYAMVSLLLTGAPWHMLDMPSTGMSSCIAMATSAKESDLPFSSLQGIPQFPRTRDGDPWHAWLYAY